MITQTAISDRAACLIAKKYVWQEYFSSFGHPVYTWEEGSDEDLGGARLVSGHAPPDVDNYGVFLISDVKITGAEVVERDSDSIEVLVRCVTTQFEGEKGDELREEEFYKLERELLCILEPFDDGWAVFDVGE